MGKFIKAAIALIIVGIISLVALLSWNLTGKTGADSQETSSSDTESSYPYPWSEVTAELSFGDLETSSNTDYSMLESVFADDVYWLMEDLGISTNDGSDTFSFVGDPSFYSYGYILWDMKNESTGVTYTTIWDINLTRVGVIFPDVETAESSNINWKDSEYLIPQVYQDSLAVTLGQILVPKDAE